MPLKSRRFCASQYFDCILLCGLYIGLHYTTFFEICTSWNPTGRPVAGLKHGFQGSQAVNISHHFVALKCSLEPPSNIARHSQTQPKTPPVQSFSIKTEDDCMLEERLSQETSGATMPPFALGPTFNQENFSVCKKVWGFSSWNWMETEVPI